VDMSSADAYGAGNADPASSADIQKYVTAVDDLLLDVPWRRRRDLIAELREHIRESPELITIEPPQEYAAELRATCDAVPGGLLSGIRSASWPTPVQWWESVLRGTAVVFVAKVAYELLYYALVAVVGDRSSMGTFTHMIDSAFQSVYPIPRVFGSRESALLIIPLMAVVVGQSTTAAVLLRAPHRRPTLRTLTYVSVATILLLLGYGALRSSGWTMAGI
jgi:hypothetical protein